MQPQEQPQPVGESLLAPPSLTTSQEELCEKLDQLHSLHGLRARPSDMFRGAIFASRAELRNNPDWISQAANSLREILYPFVSGRGVPRTAEALRQYGSVRIDDRATQEIGRLLGVCTELTHHGNSQGNSVNHATFTPTDFERLLIDFERIMLNVLSQQLDVHGEIDSLFINEAVTVEVVDAPPTNI